MLAHTQAQISILLGLDEFPERTFDGTDDSISDNAPRIQDSGPPNTVVEEEARALILNNATTP